VKALAAPPRPRSTDPKGRRLRFLATLCPADVPWPGRAPYGCCTAAPQTDDDSARPSKTRSASKLDRIAKGWEHFFPNPLWWQTLSNRRIRGLGLCAIARHLAAASAFDWEKSSPYLHVPIPEKVISRMNTTDANLTSGRT